VEIRTESEGSFLNSIRVIELADELGEYCGKVLAGLGADVIKVEPLGGETTRGYGPFYGDEPGPNRSIYFWHYNFGKRGVTIDLETEIGREQFRKLAASADVVIDTRPRNYLEGLGLGYDRLKVDNPGLIYARISPFGDDGPWADYVGSDLVHLALGGVTMNCGYDPMPTGEYDTPPIAPQMWQSYHIAGEIMAMQVVAALIRRLSTGRGQKLTTSVHEAVSKNTETDLPDWIYSRRPHQRLTCRHSFPLSQVTTEGEAGSVTTPGISATKDGRWVLPYRTYLPGAGGALEDTVKVLQGFGMEDDLGDEKYRDADYVRRPEVTRHISAVIDRFVASFLYDRDIWRAGQEQGLAWAPVRRPEENVGEDHWAQRETFLDVDYPEIGRTFTQVGAKWMAPGLPWRSGPRAPLLGEHNSQVLREPARARRPIPKSDGNSVGDVISKRGKPFALSGVRVVDLGWVLASAGAGRFFSALGAEVIKVEHLSKIDMLRFSSTGTVGEGGRSERDSADGPIMSAPGLNRSGQFMDVNAGKRALSLNLKDPEGRRLLELLLQSADVVVEGFSPGTMDRMGLGYERLTELNPRIVYVQQSGLGQIGTYGRFRSFGPTAQAFSGISEMSGLPEPYPPAGIGYSYLDWFGAYQMAIAMAAGLYRQRVTGKGCWIDSSQVETGIYLTGTAVIDYAVNGRPWQRFGNRSPYKKAAPSGVYRTSGIDQWIAISIFTEQQWLDLTRVLNISEVTSDPRLADLSSRLRHQSYLDGIVGGATQSWDGKTLMTRLQSMRIPAGICQSAEDRYEWDPQLRHLDWLVELDQTEIGRWPVKEIPVKYSETPPYVGGFLDRSGPNYGEDNDYVLREILGLTDGEIGELVERGVI
jgi:crotonobetainyl-CoA:carnitine CoA-transferase CaiB-like acyl-CoA transferase